jgi:Fe2+ transport system protein FeoA
MVEMSDLSLHSLNELKPAQRGLVRRVRGSHALRRRLLDMGVVPGEEIEVIRIAPLGDPVEYLVRGYRLSLRRSEAAHVLVERLPCQDCPELEKGTCDESSVRRCPRWLAWLAGRGRDGRGR